MKRSPLTAHLRVLLAGKDQVHVYYVNISDELEFVGRTDVEHILDLVQEFALALGFDGFEVGFTVPPAVAAQLERFLRETRRTLS
jgi:hypothetical protein